MRLITTKQTDRLLTDWTTFIALLLSMSACQTSGLGTIAEVSFSLLPYLDDA